jgi:outer membrane protein OmpA-like peptidoglycan-associated protein
MAYRSARSRRVARGRPSPRRRAPVRARPSRRRTPPRYERAIRSAHHPAWPWSPGARAAGGGWPWIILATLLAVGAVVVITAFSVHAYGHTCTSANDRIIWADQVTAEEGDQSSPPPGLVDQADRLASCGGGHLAVIRSAGQGGVQAGPVVSLSVARAPGQPENDPTARRTAVAHKIGAAFQKARNTPVPGAGRDITGMLGAIAAELGSGHNDVWIHTLGLPTVAPADARILMAADPAQAAASIARFVPSLRGADVHLILARSAGAQPQLNTVTDAWRRAFMIDLLRQAGAHVESVQEVEAVERPAPGAPSAPVVPNLPENTPAQPKKPQPGRPYQLRLDTSAIFLPDSAQFAVSDAQVLAQLQPIIRAWRTGGYARVIVIGHTAKFGPADTAVLLSRKRAAEVASLLQRSGVSDVRSDGVGYAKPLTPADPQDPANRAVTVTAYPTS